ncbi:MULTISPECIES: hypothetical protein [Nonomuraea]|uniref:Glyoxalase/Bleomycin resistance-like N-terminal domain-containing protein n=1 Tax=Nonomuraea ferruginea TaxID=46174 RepID=A0ABT4TAL5_9ACTN|nr:hypothetical protein [Nonomuraea ferruginea]MDA0646454.1 hypothetical protein [Nonomuraea ferruginea]
MGWKIEVVPIPVADVEKAKGSYSERLGFTVDHDSRVNEETRVVRLTPPGSGCSM